MWRDAQWIFQFFGHTARARLDCPGNRLVAGQVQSCPEITTLSGDEHDMKRETRDKSIRPSPLIGKSAFSLIYGPEIGMKIQAESRRTLYKRMNLNC